MSTDKTSIEPISPTFSSMVFYAIYGFFFFLFSYYTLFSLSSKITLPFLPTLLGSLLIGGFLGFAFGEILVKPQPWWRLFLWACLMIIAAFLLLSFGVMIYGFIFDPYYVNHFQRWQDYFIIFGLINLTIIFIMGPWLLILTSLATVYFNKHFYPGLAAVDKQRQISQSSSKQ